MKKLLWLFLVSSCLAQINNGGGGGTPAYSAITAGSNTAAKTEGTGGSTSPLNLGQNVANQFWFGIAFTAPTLTLNNSGGSLSNTHNIIVEYTLVSAAGETNPSNFTTQATGASCTGTNQCQVVVTAPFIPPGFTGYTVYDCDAGASSTCVAAGTTFKQQTASVACVNITINCNINVGAAGAIPPTTNSAYLTPPGTLGADLCSPNTQPFMFLSDGTNYYPYMGMDAVNTGTNPSGPYNKLTICRPFWYNDGGIDPPGGRNAAVLISHAQNGAVINTATNQDRAMFVNGYNVQPGGSDSSAHYALEAIQAEEDIIGTPTITGSPDGEAAAGSFQLSFSATSAISSSLGSNAIRAQNFRQASASGDTGGMSGIYAIAQNNSAVAGGGLLLSAVKATCAGVNDSGIACSDFLINNSPTTNAHWPNGLKGITVINNGSFTPSNPPVNSASDFFIRNDQTNWWSNFNAPILINKLGNSSQGAIPVLDPLTVSGSVNAAGITAPTFASAHVCSGGASTYTYQLVGLDAKGGKKAGASLATPGTCVNPLTAPNPVTMTITFPVGLGIVTYDVWRTAGPMATGKIGSGQVCGNTNAYISGCNTFVDSGLAAVTTEGTVPPPTDTTGTVAAAGYSLGTLNTVQVAASDFTTANNTSLQTITGLTWNLLPGLARNYYFECDLAYSQATANVAVAFGIQAATNNPTNIFATGIEQITVGPPATIVTGTLATLATTTATNIVSGTPTALATNYTVHLAGTIENPANTQNVINIMVSTAAGADAVSVKRGSPCTLHP